MTNEENSNLKEEKIVLTPNGMKVLEYFQSFEDGNIQIVGKDLIDILNIKGIYPVLNSLKMILKYKFISYIMDIKNILIWEIMIIITLQYHTIINLKMISY